MDPLGLIFVAGGLFSIAGAVFDWEWFMNHHKARFMSALLTRTGARVFYVVLGLVLAVLGVLMTMRAITL